MKTNNRIVIPANAGIQIKAQILYMKFYYVYILASKKNGTLYIGVTGDIVKRVYIHKNSMVEGFTKKYSVHKLVYFEQCTEIMSALEREKQLKNWHRDWKIGLIEKNNPEWRDLYDEITGEA